jgi:hypothetical protein
MVSEELEPAVEEQFATQGHGTWADLAPSTIERKKRLGFPLDKLIETGAMRGSFHQSDPFNFTEITRDRLRWGSRLQRSMFHQTGTGSGFQQRQKGAGRGMPMRKIIELSEQRKRALRSILVRHLAQIARREGFAILGSDQTPMSARRAGQIALGL